MAPRLNGSTRLGHAGACRFSRERNHPVTEIRTIRQALSAYHVAKPYGGVAESTFFTLSFYKKGTVHLRFKDAAG